VYFNRAGFAILDDSGIALEMPELCVFPATERRSFRPYKGYVTCPILEQVPSLKLVQRIGVGYDKVDVKAATRARLFAKLLGVLGSRILPIATQMGFKIDLILRNARPSGLKYGARSSVSPPRPAPPAAERSIGAFRIYDALLANARGGRRGK
jgi:hypothetical protein